MSYGRLMASEHILSLLIQERDKIEAAIKALGGGSASDPNEDSDSVGSLVPRKGRRPADGRAEESPLGADEGVLGGATESEEGIITPCESRLGFLVVGLDVFSPPDNRA